VAIPEARAWLLDRKIVPNEVGVGLIDDTRAYLESLEPRRLAEYLIGGLATTDLPAEFRGGDVSLAREATGARDYLMPPLPNTLYNPGHHVPGSVRRADPEPAVLPRPARRAAAAADGA
jgi:arginine deiminase